jgi:DNA-directed RNA polymerase subunit H (RpoH/RPB5)
MSSELNLSLEMAQYFNCFNNTLEMLNSRGYDMQHQPIVNFEMFKERFNKSLDDELVFQSISFVVSKAKTSKPMFTLPNITRCISSLLETADKLRLAELESKEADISCDCVEVCDEIMQRDVLKLQDMIIPRCDNNEVVVLFCRKSSALGIEAVMQILKFQQLLRCNHLMLILKNDSGKNVLTSLPKKLLNTRRYPEQTKNGAIVEWFDFQQVAADITKTIYHARFEKFSKARAKEWLKEHRLKPEQLETIALNDPIALYYDFRYQDFIAIHDHDNTTSYVIIGTNK